MDSYSRAIHLELGLNHLTQKQAQYDLTGPKNQRDKSQNNNNNNRFV